MSIAHRWICSSEVWRRGVAKSLRPWALEGVELGPALLEVGPGYGATTDVLLAEVARVLRPGGVFAGTDSRTSVLFRLPRLFDTMVPVDPGAFADRLRAAGFDDARVDAGARAFRFRARKAGSRLVC